MRYSDYLSNGPWYSLIALFMPLSVLTAAVFLVNALLSADLPLILILACAFLSAIAASFYCDLMKDIKASRTAANIRGGIIVMIVLYIFASLFVQSISWEEKFQPDTPNVISSIAALYTWVNVVRLKRLFSACKLFDKYTTQYSGEKLQEMIFNESSLLYFTDEKIIKVVQNYFLKFFILGILAIICAVNGIPLPAVLYVLLIVILVGGICTFGFFGVIKLEHYYAGEGVGLAEKDRTKRLVAMIVFSLFCLAAALLLASDKSLLPFSLVIGLFIWFFDWFSALFRRPVQESDDTFVEENIFEEAEWVPTTALPVFEEIQPSPLWAMIFRYLTLFLKYVFFVMAAFVFIRYMISPLINRGKVSTELTFFQRLWRIIKEWFSGIIAAIITFSANLKYDKDTLKLKKSKDAEINRTAKNILDAYSPAKKRDMRRSVNLFARLILWGSEARNVTWKPSLAALEYCNLLAATEPDSICNTALIRCGELFEKALYSREVLSAEERREFSDNIEKITS